MLLSSEIYCPTEHEVQVDGVPEQVAQLELQVKQTFEPDSTIYPAVQAVQLEFTAETKRPTLQDVQVVAVFAHPKQFELHMRHLLSDGSRNELAGLSEQETQVLLHAAMDCGG